MRRFIGILFVLIVLGAIGFTVYALLADLPAPVDTVETPATGVGFGE